MKDKYDDIDEILEYMADPDMLPLPEGFHESVMNRIELKEQTRFHFRVPVWAANTAATLILVFVFAVMGINHWSSLEKGAMDSANVEMATMTETTTEETAGSAEFESAADTSPMMLEEAPAAAEYAEEQAVAEDAEEQAAPAEIKSAPIDELAREAEEAVTESGPWLNIFLAVAGFAALSLLVVNIIRRKH